MLHCLAQLACVCVPAGTASAASPTYSVLDRSTGATLELSASPWIFALEHPQQAAHARDYVALHAVEINIAGARRLHLAAFFWSTILGRERYAGSTPSLTLRVDDRQLRLEPLGKTPRDLGISRWPLKPPGRGAVLVVYEVDAALLVQLSRAARCTLRPETDPTIPADVWFETWRDGREAFAGFIAKTRDTG